jgi:restriction endonuclease S subunit
LSSGSSRTTEVTPTVNPLSLIERSGRWDSEYFLPEYLELEDSLKGLPTVPLGELAKVIGSAFYPAASDIYSESGLPFLRCLDVINYPVITADQPVKRIPEGFVRANDSIRTIMPVGIVITKVGTPCFSGIVSDSLGECALSRTVLGLKDIKQDKVDPFYLTAYLMSPVGFLQLYREREQQIQFQLTLDRVRNLRVFLPDKTEQRRIGLLLEDYGSMVRSSSAAFSKQQKFLRDSLGLNAFDALDSVTYETRLAEVNRERRFDAEYFQPKFIRLEEMLEKVGAKPLASLVAISKGVEVGSSKYVDEGILFIRVSNLTKFGVETGDADKYLSAESFSQLRDRFQPREGEVLLSKDGSPGIGTFVSEDVEGIISGGILKLKPNRNAPKPYYLSLIINSEVCQMQIEREASGAIISHWRPELVKKLLVPLLEQKDQDEATNGFALCISLRKDASKKLAETGTRISNLMRDEGKKSDN